jgi:drug/metabolite transporter (DMT)-like permease
MDGGFSWKSILGILSILASSILFTGLNTISKVIYNSSNITAFEMAYLRCLTTIIANGLYAQYLKLDILAVSKHVAGTLFYRVIFATFGFVFGFLGLKLMSFSEYTSVSYVYPMLTQIAAYLIIKEKLTIYDGISCVLSFGGVLIIASHYNGGSNKEAESLWVFAAPLTAAAFWALGDVYQRKIKAQIHYVVCPIYLCIGGCIGCSVLVLLYNSETNHYTSYSLKIVALIIVAGLFGTAGTVFSALAFQYEKAGRLVIFNYLSVPYALLVDYFYFKIDLNFYNLLGAFLIVAGSATITFLKGFGLIG